MDVLEHRKSKITGAIMANGLADRFKRGDESVMEMMKRIKGENYNGCKQLTNGKTNQKNLAWFLVMTKFPKGALYHWSPMGAFCPAKVKRQSKFTLPFFLFFKESDCSECLRATQ